MQVFFFGLILLGTAPGYASVSLKVSASNPSSFAQREVSVKSYLPVGIRPENVIDAGGLQIGYDVRRGQCYVYADIILKPQEAVNYAVEIDDIWLIENEELDGLAKQADELVGKLKDTQYIETSLEIQKEIQEKIGGIRKGQEDSLIFKVGPTEHITAYQINQETLTDVKDNIADLGQLLSAVKEKKGGAGDDSTQSKRAELVEAKKIKQRILYVGEGEETPCLVEEALKKEERGIHFEAPKTVLMKIRFENPSSSERQVAPLRYFLAREVHAKDVVDSGGLDVGFDFEKTLYYVYDDAVELEPGEVRELALILNNKWVIDKREAYGFKVYIENMMQVVQGIGKFDSVQKLGRQTLQEIYELLERADAAELTESHVVTYRNDLEKLKRVHQSVQRMEDLLTEGGVSPEISVMENEALCEESQESKGGKLALGMPSISEARHVKLLAGTIFEDKTFSEVATWKIIYYIILFLGLVSGIFYFVNIRQRHSTMFDTLTGAFSRGYALERFREELKIAKGSGGKCSLLVMDIDKFKGINDTHGHSVGDTILKEFIIAVRKGIRATDLVGRFGGDEFIIILPTGAKEKSLEIANGIARIVDGRAVRISPKLTIDFTTSIGVATFPDDSMTADDMFDKADQALYKVKQRGGNGAEAYGEEE